MADILYIVLAAIGVLLVTVIAIYAFAPRLMFDALRVLMRKRGKLTSKMISAGGFNWPYLEGGAPDGDPVILLHGFGGDGDIWAMYASHFGQKYRFIAPDLPGFGRNSRDVAHDYDIKTQAARLHDFLDAIGIGKCHLGGNSMGGFIALRFALDFPDRLLSLTLINNAGVVGANETELQMQGADTSQPPAINSPEDLKVMMAMTSYKPLPMPGQFLKLFYEEHLKYSDLNGKMFVILAEEALDRPLNDQLKNVQAPTLIIWGKNDQLIDVSCAKALTDGIPGSEAVILDETGHMPMVENPKKTAAAHLSFLAIR